MQNLHTHTTYCDGKLTAEEMVRAAIEKGCGSIGFSEHSYVPFDFDYSMTPELTREYFREIRSLKDKYRGVIDVFLGIEQDMFSEGPTDGLDYIIGTAHYIKCGGGYETVDAGVGNLKRITREFFGGDVYAAAEAYYATAAELVRITGADIVGHFDLVAKYNIDKCVFDDDDPRYIKAALGAMDAILADCRLFEVNTGAMYRIGKTEPYPSGSLLRELRARGGEVILSSDSHDAQSLCHMFGDMRELLKACGFKYLKRLTNDGFIDEKL